MSEQSLSKQELWKLRIREYRNSGLTAREWCSQNSFTVSTLRYWIYRLNKEQSSHSEDSKPVFCRITGSYSVFIPWSSTGYHSHGDDPYRDYRFLPSRPAVQPDSNPYELCLNFHRTVPSTLPAEHGSKEELPCACRHCKTEIQPGSILPMHVCLLQQKQNPYENPEMGRFRLLAFDEAD